MMITERKCNLFVSTYYGNDSGYPHTYCYDAILKNLNIYRRTDAAQVTSGMTQLAKSCLAIKYLVESDPIRLITSLDESDLVLLKEIITTAEDTLRQLKNELMWGDYEYCA